MENGCGSVSVEYGGWKRDGGRGRVNGIPGVSEMLADVDAVNYN